MLSSTVGAAATTAPGQQRAGTPPEHALAPSHNQPTQLPAPTQSTRPPAGTSPGLEVRDTLEMVLLRVEAAPLLRAEPGGPEPTSASPATVVVESTVGSNTGCGSPSPDAHHVVQTVDLHPPPTTYPISAPAALHKPILRRFFRTRSPLEIAAEEAEADKENHVPDPTFPPEPTGHQPEPPSWPAITPGEGEDGKRAGDDERVAQLYDFSPEPPPQARCHTPPEAPDQKRRCATPPDRTPASTPPSAMLAASPPSADSFNPPDKSSPFASSATTSAASATPQAVQDDAAIRNLLLPQRPRSPPALPQPVPSDGDCCRCGGIGHSEGSCPAPNWHNGDGGDFRLASKQSANKPVVQSEPAVCVSAPTRPGSTVEVLATPTSAVPAETKKHGRDEMLHPVGGELAIRQPWHNHSLMSQTAVSTKAQSSTEDPVATALCPLVCPLVCVMQKW